jgi:hypothetical protein
MADEPKDEKKKDFFGDVERAFEEALAMHLDQVLAIDRSDVTVTSWEADFLDSVLKQLQNQKKPLTATQLDIVRRMCGQYDIECDL